MQVAPTTCKTIPVCVQRSPGSETRSECHRRQLILCNRIDQPQSILREFNNGSPVLSVCGISVTPSYHLADSVPSAAEAQEEYKYNRSVQLCKCLLWERVRLPEISGLGGVISVVLWKSVTNYMVLGRCFHEYNRRKESQ